MRKVLFVFAVAASLIATNAQASNIQNTRIINIIPNNGGVVQIYIETPRSAIPSCAGVNTVQFSFNVNTPAGQAILSAIYLAFASDIKVDIAGTGVCDVEAGVESIGYVSIHR